MESYPPLFKELKLKHFLATSIPLSHTAPEGNFSKMILKETMSRNQGYILHILAGLRTARVFVEYTGGFDAVFTYEDLLENSEEMSRLFGLFGMKNFSMAWRKQDSQEKTFFSQEKLKHVVTDTMEPFQEIVNFLGVPCLDSSMEDLKKYIKVH